MRLTEIQCFLLEPKILVLSLISYYSHICFFPTSSQSASLNSFPLTCILICFFPLLYGNLWKRQWHPTPELGGAMGGRLQTMGSRRVRHDWATSLSLFTFMHWRRKWQPTPVFLPGESQGRGAWWPAVYGVAQSRTRLKRLSSSSMAP